MPFALITANMIGVGCGKMKSRLLLAPAVESEPKKSYDSRWSVWVLGRQDSFRCALIVGGSFDDNIRPSLSLRCDSGRRGLATTRTTKYERI